MVPGNFYPRLAGSFKQASEVTDIYQLIETYSDVFNGLGLLPGEHTIRLKDDVTLLCILLVKCHTDYETN